METQSKSTKVNVNSQSQRKSQHDAFGTKIRDKTLKATGFIVNKYILCQQNIFNRFVILVFYVIYIFCLYDKIYIRLNVRVLLVLFTFVMF